MIAPMVIHNRDLVIQPGEIVHGNQQISSSSASSSPDACLQSLDCPQYATEWESLPEAEVPISPECTLPVFRAQEKIEYKIRSAYVFLTDPFTERLSNHQFQTRFVTNNQEVTKYSLQTGIFSFALRV